MRTIATYHKMAAWLKPFGRRVSGLVIVMLWLSGALMGQEINVSDAVISIPEGVSLSTDGGITLSQDGMIALDGQLSLRGDWTNDGKGLSNGSRGEVVFAGKDQRIGGRFATQFHDVQVAVKGSLELSNAMAVSGDLNLISGILVTHFHDIEFKGAGKLIENGAICRMMMERPEEVIASETQIAQASNGGTMLLGLASSAGVGVGGPQVRVRGGQSSVKSTSVRSNLRTQPMNRASVQGIASQNVPTGAFHQAAIVTMQAHAAGLSDGDGNSEAEIMASQVAAFVVCGPQGSTNMHQTRKQDSGPAFASSFFVIEFSRIISC